MSGQSNIGSFAGSANHRAAWRRTLAVLVPALVVLLFAFHETAASMVRIWLTSDAYGHGIFIVPIALFLVWRRRRTLREQMPRAAVSGWAVIVLGAAGWLVGVAAGVELAKQLCLVLMAQGLVVTLIGWRSALHLAFPLLYLYLMVPFGKGLVSSLQEIAAWLVFHMLRLAGTTVNMEGLYLNTPAGAFLIAEACAGLRFMLAILALGLLYGELVYSGWVRRGVFLLLAVLLTLLANALRVVGVILVAEATGQGAAIAADHLTYGWVFLSLLLAVLFLVGLIFRSPSTGDGPGEVAAAGLPVVGGARARSVIASLGAIVLVLAAAVYGRIVVMEPDATAAAFHARAPERLGDWIKEPAATGDWSPAFAGADAELSARYRKGAARVDLYFAYYHRQRQGAELVNAANRLAASPPWQRLERSQARLGELGGDVEVPVLLFGSAGGDRRAGFRATTSRRSSCRFGPRSSADRRRPRRLRFRRPTTTIRKNRWRSCATSPRIWAARRPCRTRVLSSESQIGVALIPAAP
jgi:exosortase A